MKFKVGDRILLDKEWADRWPGFERINYIYTIKKIGQDIVEFEESNGLLANYKHISSVNSQIIKERLGIK